ncbi:5-methylcytosine rRNA methyltransferase l(2)10685 isoform X2 [Lycorma delicatula]
MFWTKNISSITNIKCTSYQFGAFFQSKRWKNGPSHWAVEKKNQTAIYKALEHFDDFYSSVYGKTWKSIRVALLSPQKYCAVINNYDNSEATATLLKNEGAFNMRDAIKGQKNQLKKQSEELKRKKELDAVHAMDRKLEKITQNKEHEELQTLYPKNVCIPDQVIDKEFLCNDNSIDWSRQIDSKSGLSTTALYDFIPTSKLKGREDWVSESEHYSYYEKYLKVPIDVAHEDDLNFPEHLQVYSFETSNVSSFQEPQRGSTGVFNYYLMNASSLLPVLALNLAPGDRVLDMCAAPGGKSIIALQTLYPDLLVCNDSSRSERLKRVLKDYFYNLKQVKFTMRDGRFIDETDLFNKILVDVPCTNDRLSVNKNDNNIFKKTRLKERFRLPELQADLLSNALKLITVGGTVVYSTCSLSPIQNDGVVQMALRRIWEESNHRFVIKDLKNALEPAKLFYRFGETFGMKYGHIVIPYLPANFGPLYFCKFVRIE